MTNVEIRDDRFGKVVGDDAPVEEVAGGFRLTEGAVWHHVDRYLVFSDILADVMLKWTAGGGIEAFRAPSHMANGNYHDRQGRLLTCEHATSRVVRSEHDGSLTVLATHYRGRQLNSPNDIVVGQDDTVYFTDPTFGRMAAYGVAREPELDFRGVYKIDPRRGELTLLVDDFDQPNGLTLSLDGTRLFVNDSVRCHVRVFDVAADSTIANGRVWATVTGDRAGVPDGMKIDSADNLYVTGPGGVQIFAPDAVCLGTIYVPREVTNFTWGDDDLRTLYITAGASLYRTRVKVPGRRLF